MADQTTAADYQVALAEAQRTCVFRKNHGWVKTKRCSFCNSMSHVDDLGVWLLGRDYFGLHHWYCSVTCAKGISYANVRRMLAVRRPARS